MSAIICEISEPFACDWCAETITPGKDEWFEDSWGNCFDTEGCAEMYHEFDEDWDEIVTSCH